MHTYRRPNYSSIDMETALERIRQLEEEAGLTFQVHPRYGLTKSEETLLGIIAHSHGICTKEHAYNTLYGMSDDPPLQKILDVFVCTLRRKLSLRNITIATAWGRGWYLEPDERAKVMAMRVQSDMTEAA